MNPQTITCITCLKQDRHQLSLQNDYFKLRSRTLLFTPSLRIQFWTRQMWRSVKTKITTWSLLIKIRRIVIISKFSGKTFWQAKNVEGVLRKGKRCAILRTLSSTVLILWLSAVMSTQKSTFAMGGNEVWIGLEATNVFMKNRISVIFQVMHSVKAR